MTCQCPKVTEEMHKHNQKCPDCGKRSLYSYEQESAEDAFMRIMEEMGVSFEDCTIEESGD